MAVTKKTGNLMVVKVISVEQEEEVVAISKQSQVIRVDIKEIPSLGRQYGILDLMIPKGMFSRVGDYYFTEKSYSEKYI